MNPRIPIAIAFWFGLSTGALSQQADAIKMSSYGAQTAPQLLDLVNFYGGVAALRGPAEINIWAAGSMTWVAPTDYTGYPPRAAAVGMDVTAIDGWIVGVAVGSAGMHGSLTNDGDYRMNGWGAGAYARRSWGAGPGVLTLAFLGAAVKNDFESNRAQIFGGQRYVNLASFGGYSVDGGAQLGYSFQEKWFSHGPSISFKARYSEMDAFTETNAPTARSFSRQERTTNTLSFGYNFNYTGFNTITPYVSPTAAYKLRSSGNILTSTGGGVTRSTPLVGSFERWSYSLELGLRANFSPRMSVTVAWSGDYDEHISKQSDTATIALAYGF